MLKLLLSKDAIYIAIILAMVGSAWYVLNDWHYKPLKQKDAMIKVLGTKLNECLHTADICDANLSKIDVEAFIEGLGETNETIDFDLDNLTT